MTQSSTSTLSRFPPRDPATTLIRISEVMAIVGLARPTIYKLMQQPENGFPTPVKLSTSTARGAPVAWVLEEVQSWTRARIAHRASRQGGGMNRSLIRKTTINSFGILREIGFSATRMKLFEKLRQRHEAQGHALMVLSWPDGIWCVLILHTERLGAVVLDDVDKAEAYHDARQMACENITPILHLRFELHA